MELIINDQNITNDRNWRLRNLGCDRSRFEANPVLLYQHSTDHVIGRCSGLRIEGSQLRCTVEFDEEDALARSVKRKMEQGFIRGVSPGFFIEKMSFGEAFDTVDWWELLEVSIVTVPSNKGALRLYSREGVPLDEQLEADYLHQLRAIATQSTIDMNTEPQSTPSTLPESLSAKASEALGVLPHATPTELNAKIEALAEENAENRAKLEAIRAAERDALLDKAVKEDRLPEIHRAAFSKFYDREPDLCKAVLAAMQVNTTLASQVVPTSALASDSRFEGDWDELDRKELLSALKAENPDLFERKFREKFATMLNGAKYYPPPTPTPITMAIQREIWANTLVGNLFATATVLSKAVDHSAFLNGKTVHVPNAAAPATIVRNPTTFPRSARSREDVDLTYPLHLYTIEPIRVGRAILQQAGERSL